MSHPKILAFGHQKYVGKDKFVTFCFDLLRPLMSGKKMLRRGFADKLYDACYNMYSWAGFKTRSHYSAHPEAKNDVLATGHTVRDTLIKVGNKLREFDPDVWINANLRDASFDLLFITDLRFPNEFLHVQSLGGVLINVIRPGLPVPTDEADTALNGWDHRWNVTIDNCGDLHDLYLKAERFVSEHFPR
jgi:hypothetical protein